MHLSFRWEVPEIPKLGPWLPYALWWVSDTIHSPEKQVRIRNAVLLETTEQAHKMIHRDQTVPFQDKETTAVALEMKLFI